MYSAAKMSEAIRMKRKQLKDDGVDNMVDTAALPQMNPQDVWNEAKQGQMEETMDLPEKSSAPDDPANEDIKGSSQELADLKRKMAMVKSIFDRL